MIALQTVMVAAMVKHTKNQNLVFQEKMEQKTFLVRLKEKNHIVMKMENNLPKDY
jgi:hypothetical protein